MLRVKRERWLVGDIDFAGEGSFFENAPLIISQDLRDATKVINEAGDAGVSGAHHGSPIFHASENSIRQMLTRTSGAQKPAVVGDVSEKICATQSKLPGQFSDGILETNQGRDFAAIIG